MQNHVISYVIMIAVLGLVMLRNMRGRKLRVQALWVLPVVMIGVTGYVLVNEPTPSLPVIAGLAVSILVGAAVGWQRGRLTRIELDPVTRRFTSRASPAGLIFVVLLFVVRFGLRAYVAQTQHNPAVTVAATDALLLFAVGLVAAQRIEMWIRCQGLLAKAGSPP